MFDQFNIDQSVLQLSRFTIEFFMLSSRIKIFLFFFQLMFKLESLSKEKEKRQFGTAWFCVLHFSRVPKSPEHYFIMYSVIKTFLMNERIK